MLIVLLLQLQHFTYIPCAQSPIAAGFTWKWTLINLTHVLRVPSECWKGFRKILTSVKNDSIVVHSYKKCDDFPAMWQPGQVSPVASSVYIHRRDGGWGVGFGLNSSRTRQDFTEIGIREVFAVYITESLSFAKLKWLCIYPLSR